MESNQVLLLTSLIRIVYTRFIDKSRLKIISLRAKRVVMRGEAPHKEIFSEIF